MKKKKKKKKKKKRFKKKKKNWLWANTREKINPNVKAGKTIDKGV